MKNILLILFIIPVTLIAQSSDINFKLIDGNIAWQKVYDNPVDINTYFAKIKSTSSINNVELSNEVIFGEINQLSHEYKQAGLKWASTAIYVSGMLTNAKFRVEFKDGRYRVTVSDIRMIQRNVNQLTLTSSNEIALQNIEVKNNEVKPKFLQKEGKAYDYSFNKIFEYKSEEDKNDW
jgi:hypothetical protein